MKRSFRKSHAISLKCKNLLAFGLKYPVYQISGLPNFTLLNIHSEGMSIMEFAFLGGMLALGLGVGTFILTKV